MAAALAAVTGEQLDLFGSVSSSTEPAGRGAPITIIEPSVPELIEPTVLKLISGESASGEVEAAINDGATSGEESAPGGAADEEQGAVVPLRSRPVVGSRLIQHVGTWIMMSLAQQDGLHDEVAKLGGGGDSSRIAIDATLASLAIGEGTVEGVRRLATPTAPQLLRADHTPTASAVRRRLWQLAKDHGATLMAQMGRRYVEAARADAETPAVFYVDGHFRPYSGDEVVRKGWRMQDRRVLPGISDYYIHDEDGRPLFRIDVPSHDSLSQWLMPIATRLRDALGPDERILLAFDRPGSFPADMAGLRDGGFEFVAYERKPYPQIAQTAFDQAIQIRGETYHLHEHRQKNLGHKRGRVRRISLRMNTGRQPD